MKEYQIQIKETLLKTVTVEATSAAQAKEIVERNWKNSEYILDADHLSGVEFKAIPPQKQLGMER